MPLNEQTEELYMNEWRRMISLCDQITSKLQGFRMDLKKRFVPDYGDQEGQIVWSKQSGNDALDITAFFKIFNDKGYYALVANVNGATRANSGKWLPLGENPTTALTQVIQQVPSPQKEEFQGQIQEVAASLFSYRKIYCKIKNEGQ
jgi:hypothetical protein